MFRHRIVAHFLLCTILGCSLLGTATMSGQLQKKGESAKKKLEKPKSAGRFIADFRIQGHGSVSSGDTVSITDNTIKAEVDTEPHAHLEVTAKQVWFKNYQEANPTIPALPPSSLTPVRRPLARSTTTWISGDLAAKSDPNPSINNTLVVWVYYEKDDCSDSEYTYIRKVVKYKGKTATFFTDLQLGGVEVGPSMSLNEADNTISLTLGTRKRSGVHAYRVYALLLPNEHSPNKYHDLGTVKAFPLAPRQSEKPQSDDVKLWAREKLLLRVGDPTTDPGVTVVAAKPPAFAHNTLVIWAAYRAKGKNFIEQHSIKFAVQTAPPKKTTHQPLSPHDLRNLASSSLADPFSLNR